MSTSVPHISDHMCTFKLPFGIEEWISIFRFPVNVCSVDATIALICFSVLYSVCCLVSQGPSVAVFFGNEYSSVTSFSEGLSNNKYPIKGKLATTTTKTKRRLPNNRLPKTGIRQRAINMRPSMSWLGLEPPQFKLARMFCEQSSTLKSTEVENLVFSSLNSPTHVERRILKSRILNWACH